MTKVQNANNVRVLQLASSCQDLPCKTNIVTPVQIDHVVFFYCPSVQRVPGSGSVASLWLAASLRGQRKADERQDSIVLPWGSWGRPTALGSAELMMGKYAASTAICLLIPDEKQKQKREQTDINLLFPVLRILLNQTFGVLSFFISHLRKEDRGRKKNIWKTHLKVE